MWRNIKEICRSLNSLHYMSWEEYSGIFLTYPLILV